MGRTTIPKLITIPDSNLQGPFTAYVTSGHCRQIASTSPGSFKFISQAQEWCHKERARLSTLHPRRRWIGNILDKKGYLHLFAFSS